MDALGTVWAGGHYRNIVGKQANGERKALLESRAKLARQLTTHQTCKDVHTARPNGARVCNQLPIDRGERAVCGCPPVT